MTAERETLIPLPEVGSKWVSKDRRDDGLVVTVVAVSPRFIQIKRFNKTLVKTERFHKAYRGPVTLDEGGARLGRSLPERAPGSGTDTTT